MLKKLIIVTVSCFSYFCYGQNEPKYCFTTECIRTSSKIRSWMNASVDPCSDFYEFSCGDFLKNFETEKGISPFTITNLKIEQELLSLLKNHKYGSKSFNISQKLFNLCMEDEGVDFEKYDYVNDYFANYSSWNQSTIWLMSQGLPYKILFDISVIRDKRNTSKTILKLNNPNIKEVSRDQLTKLFVNVSNEEKAINDYYKFQQMLQKVSKESTATFITMKKFQLKFNYIDWIEFFNQLLPKYAKLSKQAEIYLENPQYFLDLRRILKKTDQSTVSNFFLINSLRYLSSLKLRNLTNNKERYCLKSIRHFPGLSSTYIQKYFTKIPKDIFRIIGNLKKQLSKMIKTSDWMDASTKIYALEKLIGLNIQVGYPESFLNSSKVDSYYYNFDLLNDSFTSAMIELNLFKNDKHLRLLIPRKTDYPIYAEVTVPNVFYDIDRNFASIPVSVMQGEFFSPQRPNFINYASFGSLVGFVISSAFSLDSYLRDRHGNSIDWWNDKTKMNYLNKTDCLMKESNGNYNNLNKLISNLIGVKATYDAYKAWAKRHSEEEKIPSMPFDENKIFWIALAQNHCTQSQDLSLTTTRNLLNTIMRLSPAFNEAFNCRSNQLISSCAIF